MRGGGPDRSYREEVVLQAAFQGSRLEGPQRPAKKAGVFGFRHAITVARHAFEGRPIQHRDLTGPGRNGPSFLKALQSFAHTLSPHA